MEKDFKKSVDNTAPESEPLRSVHTSNLPALFERLQISLVVSTYQAGKVILVRSDSGVLNTHFRSFTRPIGIAADIRGYISREGVARRLKYAFGGTISTPFTVRP